MSWPTGLACPCVALMCLCVANVCNRSAYLDTFPTYGHRPSSANRHIDLLGTAGGKATAKRSATADPTAGMLASEQLAMLLFGDDADGGTGSGSGSGSASTSDTRSMALLALSPHASAKTLFAASQKLAAKQPGYPGTGTAGSSSSSSSTLHSHVPGARARQCGCACERGYGAALFSSSSDVRLSLVHSQAMR